ncbi:cytochrome c oxidase subunit II [Halobellus captivus]|uniref:cytochrome c oxidase subunit II n=1 Tax=Halobellus captivus TaxID=2592614 RepID=UPI0011A021EA|nr:cytochrome c oxidase subunit II [Halobellus captivus]
MRKTRLALVSLLTVLVAGLAADPVAAQTSASAELINGLNNKLLYIAVPVTLLVEGILIYTIVKFRNNDEPTPTKENRRLEITWTIATAIILLFVGVASYGVLADENVAGPPEVEDASGEPVVVHAEAFQWGWEMSYPEEGNVTTGTEIVVPKDRPVVIEVTSRDVIHGFHVPDLALKVDAMPDQTNTIRTVAYEEDVYQGYCTEYCGVAHSQMYFTMEVVSEDEYQDWLDEQQSSE